MSTHRTHLLHRIEAIQSVLNDAISIDTSPIPAPSSSAVVVRNGCLVMLFCALEDFMRARATECTTLIDQQAVPYPHLPEKLKFASTISSFEGLIVATRGLPDAEKIKAFEDAAQLASAGSLGSPYQFSKYSFGRERSNLNSDDVGKIATRFGVKSFWSEATKVRGITGTGAPQDLQSDFKLLALGRHRAAHAPSHIVGHQELASALTVAIDVALAFDMLVSTAIYSLSRSGLAGGGVAKQIASADLQLAFLRPHRQGWATFLGSANPLGRAKFVEAQFASAEARAVSYATQKSLGLVTQDRGLRVTNWRTCLG